MRCLSYHSLSECLSSVASVLQFYLFLSLPLSPSIPLYLSFSLSLSLPLSLSLSISLLIHKPGNVHPRNITSIHQHAWDVLSTLNHMARVDPLRGHGEYPLVQPPLSTALMVFLAVSLWSPSFKARSRLQLAPNCSSFGRSSVCWISTHCVSPKVNGSPTKRPCQELIHHQVHPQ